MLKNCRIAAAALFIAGVGALGARAARLRPTCSGASPGGQACLDHGQGQSSS